MAIHNCISDFMSRVVKSPCGCWIWTGANKGNGYGHTSKGPAHRVSYKLFIGDVSSTYDVCHKCDNRICVNPDHLFTGTRKDNMTDCVNKGRIAKGNMLPDRNGENGSAAKLTWDDVDYIRSCRLSSKSLAYIYSVTSGNINKIRSFKTWRNR